MNSNEGGADMRGVKRLYCMLLCIVSSRATVSRSHCRACARTAALRERGGLRRELADAEETSSVCDVELHDRMMGGETGTHGCAYETEGVSSLTLSTRRSLLTTRTVADVPGTSLSPSISCPHTIDSSS